MASGPIFVQGDFGPSQLWEDLNPGVHLDLFAEFLPGLACCLAFLLNREMVPVIVFFFFFFKEEAFSCVTVPLTARCTGF